jgi:hypothetical protein
MNHGVSILSLRRNQDPKQRATLSRDVARLSRETISTA